MKLFDNPIFITQRRLTHRAGVWPAILITILVGVCILLAYFFPLFPYTTRPPEEIAKGFYGFIFGAQSLLLVIGGFSKISRTLALERKEGLLDSNRLTPMSTPQLVLGYWMGSPLREFYSACALIPIGFIVVIHSGLSPGFWLGTQALLLGSALFAGLISIVVGASTINPQMGSIVAILLLCLIPGNAIFGASSLFNFIFPIYSIFKLFDSTYDERGIDPGIFGIPIPSIFYTLSAQLIVGYFVWHAALRKFEDPAKPGLSRKQTLALFGIICFLQNGLIWKNWRGAFPNQAGGDVLAWIQIGSIALGLVLAVPFCLFPEKTRVAALRSNKNSVWWWVKQSGPALAFGIATIGMLGLFTHAFLGLKANPWPFLIATINLFVVLLSFTLMLELSRLLYGPKAKGVLALWFFFIFLLPYILAAVSGFDLAEFSPFTLGVSVFSNAASKTSTNILWATLYHCLLVLCLGVIWQDRWRRFLKSAILTD